MKILVYDDNPDFGGHQVMACHGVAALVADPAIELIFMTNPANRKLARKLPTIGTFQSLETPCSTRRFQGLRNRVDRSKIQTLEKQFQALEPDLILCIQGDIEHSSQGAIAARRAGIECVSYIAIPHRMAAMGAKLGALRDQTNQYLFNQPDRFITISESMKTLLRERGCRKPITIVPNGIPAPKVSLTPQSSIVTLGLIGRVEFNQKQQDFLVRTFCTFPEAFENCRLIIAGNGPDRDALSAIIHGRDNITLLPWQDDPEALYAQIDMLVIPSRFEGVPLVMLEALARRLPVIGSRRDGMQDLLPAAWTFESENASAMAETFSNVRKNWEQEIDPLRERVLAEHSLEAFKAGFVRALVG